MTVFQRWWITVHRGALICGHYVFVER
jgi:hypothetical protein